MFRNFINRLQQIQFNPSSGAMRFFVLCIIVIASVVRIWLYGDPNLSIAGNDTLSYVEASRVPLFSSEMMTGRRLLSTNLVYKILEPKDGYQLLVNGSVETSRRVFQPGFNRISVLQLIVSIIGWGVLAFVISEHIKTPSLKILGAFTVILFAFTPQMADWDSILMSESLTFSLFALQLAILIKLAFMIYKDPNSKISAYIAAWSIVYFFWTFLRDTNLFAAFVTIGMVAILLFSIKYRNNKYLHGMLVFVIAIFFLGFYTSSNSTRSLVQIINIYGDDLLRSPARVATLKELGMPSPDSEDYQAWFQENSVKTLMKFMFIHPGYPATKIMKDFPVVFTEIKQTYFKAPERAQTREVLMAVGDALHPENTTSFLLDLFLLFGLILHAIKNENESSRPWAWICIWLFMTAGITLIPTILGDTWAVNRHALFSTTIYRMLMWMMAIIIMDIAIDQSSQKVNVPSLQPQI